MLANKYSNKHNIIQKLILTIVLTTNGSGSRMNGVSKISDKRHQRLISVTLGDMIVILSISNKE